MDEIEIVMKAQRKINYLNNFLHNVKPSQKSLVANQKVPGVTSQDPDPGPQYCAVVGQKIPSLNSCRNAGILSIAIFFRRRYQGNKEIYLSETFCGLVAL